MKLRISIVTYKLFRRENDEREKNIFIFLLYLALKIKYLPFIINCYKRKEKNYKINLYY